MHIAKTFIFLSEDNSILYFVSSSTVYTNHKNVGAAGQLGQNLVFVFKEITLLFITHK